MTGPSNHVNATLPLGWQNDWLQKEHVYERIGNLVARGFNDGEIARLVGCSDKTVFRYRHRGGRPSDDPPKRRSNVDDDTIKEKVEKLKVSNKWLARAYGVSTKRARRIRQEIGLG